MIALILVAGYATRLYPLTLNTPKPLLPVADKLMLDYIMDELDTIPHLNKVCLISNHRFADQFQKWATLRQKTHPKRSIVVLDDQTTDDSNKKGAIGDIQFAIDQLQINEDLLVMAGDNLFTYRLKDMHDYFMQVKKDLLVGIRVSEKHQLQKLAVATLDDGGKVLKLVEKPEEPETDIGIYATYFYRQPTVKLFKTYLAEGNSPDAPGNFPAWLHQRGEVYAYLAHGDCIDIGTPENYQMVNEEFPRLWSKRRLLPEELNKTFVADPEDVKPTHPQAEQDFFFNAPIYIGGHRHPDTDSIASALAYQYLKLQEGYNAIAVRLGRVNPETKLLLERFQLEAPPALTDIRTQICDLEIDHPLPLTPDRPLKEAWEALQKVQTKSLPVADEEGYFLGVISGSNVANYDLEQIFSANTTTTFANLLKTLNGQYIAGPKPQLIKAPIFLAGQNTHCHENGILLGTNVDLETLKQANQNKALCFIVCEVDYLPNWKQDIGFTEDIGDNTLFVASPYPLYQTMRLLSLATSVSSVMIPVQDMITFQLKDYLDDAKNTMLSSRYRSYPVLDEHGHIAGMISRYHLIRPNRKKVVLLDHNETAQSFPGIEQSEIIEIIDHHRIGDVTTDGPIFVRSEPVGSTSTIVANIYFEKSMVLPNALAGMLLAAILSDTIYFKSPTCTQRDIITAQKLAAIAREDMDQLAKAMFTPAPELLNMSAEELLTVDFKVFRMSGTNVAISQISAIDIEPFKARQEDLLKAMEQKKLQEDYDMVMMALTDIERGGSLMLVAGSLGDALERAYGEAAQAGSVFYLPDVMSRKKQIVPLLSQVVGIG